jgi:hypothetical protein
MSNLTKEAIEAIGKQYYSVLVDNDKNAIYRFGMKAALTNPTIFQAAGLMSVDEALRFAEWVSQNFYQYHPQLKVWVKYQELTILEKLTTEELYAKKKWLRNLQS